MSKISMRAPVLGLIGLLLGCHHIAPPGTNVLPPYQAYRLFFEQALGHEDTLALAAAVTPEFVFHARGDSAGFRAASSFGSSGRSAVAFRIFDFM